MSLENKSMTELEELASILRTQIARNPNHSTMEKVELEDVEFKLRRKEAKPGPRSDDETAS